MHITPNCENTRNINFNINDAVLIERSSGEIEAWIITEQLNEFEYRLRPHSNDRSMYRDESIEDLIRLNPNGPNIETAELLIQCQNLYDHPLKEILFEKESGVKEFYIFKLHQLLEGLEQQGNIFKESVSYKFYKNYFENVKKEIQDSKTSKLESKNIKNELYPEGIESDFKQGNIGTCYLLASLKALKQHPELMNLIIKKSIKKKDENTWTVEFLGDEHNIGPIEITADKIKKWKKKSNMSAAPGDILLELAYGSYISRSKGNNKLTMFEDHNGKIPVEGGYAHRTLADILGPLGQKCILKPNRNRYEDRTFEKANDHGEIPHFFLNKYSNIKENIVLTASSENSYLGDTDYEIIEGQKIYKQHAYSIIGFNPYTQKILISNPHDSAAIFELSFQGFNRIFKDLKFNRIDNIAKILLELTDINNLEIFKKILNENLKDANIYKITCSDNNEDLLDKILYNYHSIKDLNKKEIFKNEINQYIFNNEIELNISPLLIMAKTLDNNEYYTKKDMEDFRNNLKNALKYSDIVRLANSYYSTHPNQQNEVNRSLHYYLRLVEDYIKNTNLQNVYRETINNYLKTEGYYFQI